MSVNIAKVGVASSSLVSRSRFKKALIERLGLFLFSAFGQVKVRCLVEYLFLWVFPQSPTSINLLIQKTKITFLNLHP